MDCYNTAMVMFSPSIWRMTVSTALGLLLVALLFYSLEGITRNALPLERRPRIEMWVIEPNSLNPSCSNRYDRFTEDFERIFRVRLDIVALDWYKLPTAILAARKSGNLPNISTIPTWMIPDYASDGVLSEIAIGQRFNEQWDEKSLGRTKYLGKYWGIPFISGNLRLFTNLSYAANNGIEAFFSDDNEFGIDADGIARLSNFLSSKGANNELLGSISDNPYLLALLLNSTQGEAKTSTLDAFKRVDGASAAPKMTNQSMFFGFGFLPDRARLTYTVHDVKSRDGMVCEAFANVVFASKSEEIDRIAIGIAKMMTPKRMDLYWNTEYQDEITAASDAIYPGSLTSFEGQFRDAAAICLWLSRGMIPTTQSAVEEQKP